MSTFPGMKLTFQTSASSDTSKSLSSQRDGRKSPPCSQQDDTPFPTLRPVRPAQEIPAWLTDPSWLLCPLHCLTLCLCSNAAVRSITLYLPVLLPLTLFISAFAFKGAISKISTAPAAQKSPICSRLIGSADQYQRLNRYFFNCWDFWLQSSLCIGRNTPCLDTKLLNTSLTLEELAAWKFLMEGADPEECFDSFCVIMLPNYWQISAESVSWLWY